MAKLGSSEGNEEKEGEALRLANGIGLALELLRSIELELALELLAPNGEFEPEEDEDEDEEDEEGEEGLAEEKLPLAESLPSSVLLPGAELPCRSKRIRLRASCSRSK